MALQTRFTKQEKKRLEELFMTSVREDAMIVHEGMPIAEIYGDLGIDLGKWGLTWAEWMTANHLVRAIELMQAGTFDEIAIQINNEVTELLELLERNWRDHYPRPTSGDYMELVRYEQEAKMYAENYLMHEEPEALYKVK